MKKKMWFVLSIILLIGIVLSFSNDIISKKGAKKKMDLCKVVASSTSDTYNENLAQVTEIQPTDDISNECLSFANQGSTINAACAFQSAKTVQIIQIRWVYPGTDALEEHCHYGCLGNADSECESKCKRKPAQIGSVIGNLPCPQAQ